ncbi:MAG: Maf family protein [Bdellovibrionota bacterium]
MFKNNSKIVLASRSKRRIDFLRMLGIEFEICVGNVDEDKYRDMIPSKMVEKLSLEKAKAALKEYKKEFRKKNGKEKLTEDLDIWFIGADTDVSLGDKSLGKPKNSSDAFRILKTLEGKTHQVFSAFSLINEKLRVKEVFLTSSDITFASLSDDIIKAYINTHECYDKAGAYALQGISSAFISSVNGSYSSVIGLDMNLLREKLLEYGVIECRG